MANIICIILIQKRVIRLIHGVNRWDHTKNLFYEYRILKFNYIVKLITILFMFDAYVPILRHFNAYMAGITLFSFLSSK